MAVNELKYLHDYADCKHTAAGKIVTVSGGTTFQQLAQSDKKQRRCYPLMSEIPSRVQTSQTIILRSD